MMFLTTTLTPYQQQWYQLGKQQDNKANLRDSVATIGLMTLFGLGDIEVGLF